MVRQTNTREQIVDRARKLLQSRGFNGFSYQDISTHLGIKNAAVHYHFRSKDDLGLALVEEAAAEVREQIRYGREAGISPSQQMEVYFRQIENEAATKEMSICPVGALSVNFANISADMQACLSRLLEDIRAWMARILAQGRESGEFSFQGPAEDRAAMIMAAVQGGRQITRIVGNVDLPRIINQLRADLKP
jgi:TetR/AcrR family transcriptional repressor of nem operon